MSILPTIHKTIVAPLPVDLSICVKPVSTDYKPMYESIRVFEPYESRFLQEIAKPSFDTMHKEAFMWSSTIVENTISIDLIRMCYCIQTKHRRARGTPFFKPDLYEVLLQLPDICRGNMWICTVASAVLSTDPTIWNGTTYVCIVA
jgi:hypothetical protein